MRGRSRLAPQPDGYAQYVDDIREPERNYVPGNPGGNRGQRSIRSTVTLLLVIPLVTLIGLLAFTGRNANGNGPSGDGPAGRTR